jgi:two-component system, response regulator PhcR
VSEPQAAERPRPLIVYVDDERANRLVFEQALANESFGVLCVADAAAALEVLGREAVAVIVTDMRMPAMNGEELLRVVKERHPETIRMVVTAYADVEPILRAINEGLVARYIIKPWQIEELVQVLRWATEAWTFGRDSAALHRRLLETERLATLGSIAGHIAHDIATPMQGLITNAEQLLYQVKAIPLLRAALTGGMLSPVDHMKIVELLDDTPGLAEDLHASALHLKALVQALAQYNRPGRSVNPMFPPATDPLPIVRHAMAVCADIAIKSKSTIHYDGPAELPRVRISGTELTQVLINLIANAAQAVAAGGHVEIHARTNDGALEVVVEDDGVGMPAEVLARVGTPFFTTRSEGTGLGIAQCQRLIGTAGGRFRIESTVGKGTTVTITLPLAA